MPAMETGYDLSQEMRPWVSPSLIEANYILSLSRMELEAAVAAEMASNPALDIDERATCPTCGAVLDGTFCPTCLTSQRPDGPLPRDEDIEERLQLSAVTREEPDDTDPMALVAADQPIQEQILADARAVLEPWEHPIAEYLIDALDERGFLTCDLAEVADLIDQPVEAVEAVLEVIQDVAPVGVGARDLRECLLLQIRYLRESGEDVPLAVERIVDSHLTEFGSHKYGQIARDLGLSQEEIEESREFIRAHLNPFPLQSDQAKSWRSPNSAGFVAPDVIISIKDGELVAEVVETNHFRVRVNPLYDRLASELGRRRPAVNPSQNGHGTLATALASTSEEDKQHVRHYAGRAKLFIANIQQRRETLLRVSQCLCELQESFLRGGVRELRPLTRAVVAQQVGVHESTVSRATANKYVMLPSRKVIPFSDFFTPSLSVKDVIKELIEREQHNGSTEPLTDRRICDLLLREGIRIARRTVAKYRAELGILPSTMR